jgi:hypothetical protein
MSTLNEYTYQIVEAVRPEIHDDDIIDHRHIKDLIHNQRAVWVRNELNKNRDIPEQLIQDLGCVPLQKANTIECCDFSGGCKIMRTVNKIPTPISLHHREAIERVGPADMLGKPYSIKDYKQAIFAGNGRFNKEMYFAFYRNGYLFVVSKDVKVFTLKNINIRLVASDPTEAAIFNHCSGEACYTDDSEYPLTDWMWQYMKEYIINEVFRKYGIPRDPVNDGDHSINAQQG